MPLTFLYECPAFQSQNHRAKELAFRRSRENMMWTLLQYVSGSISKNTTDDFVSVLGLIELLYRDEKK